MRVVEKLRPSAMTRVWYAPPNSLFQLTIPSFHSCLFGARFLKSGPIRSWFIFSSSAAHYPCRPYPLTATHFRTGIGWKNGRSRSSCCSLTSPLPDCVCPFRVPDHRNEGLMKVWDVVTVKVFVHRQFDPSSSTVSTSAELTPGSTVCLLSRFDF